MIRQPVHTLHQQKSVQWVRAVAVGRQQPPAANGIGRRRGGTGALAADRCMILHMHTSRLALGRALAAARSSRSRAAGASSLGAALDAIKPIIGAHCRYKASCPRATKETRNELRGEGCRGAASGGKGARHALEAWEIPRVRSQKVAPEHNKGHRRMSSSRSASLVWHSRLCNVIFLTVHPPAVDNNRLIGQKRPCFPLRG